MVLFVEKAKSQHSLLLTFPTPQLLRIAQFPSTLHLVCIGLELLVFVTVRTLRPSKKVCLLVVSFVVFKKENFEGTNNDCENDCSGHGSCVAGSCVCTDPWTGDDCSVQENVLQRSMSQFVPLVFRF